MDRSQSQSGLAWPCGLPGTSPQENITSRHAQGHIAVGNATTFHPGTSDSDDSDTAIGTALKNGRFKCNMPQCATKSYKRPAELRRHYNTRHAADKPEFWCEVLHCDRSAGTGGRPFHRKYRLQDHMRKLHGGRVEMSSYDDN